MKLDTSLFLLISAAAFLFGACFAVIKGELKVGPVFPLANTVITRDGKPKVFWGAIVLTTLVGLSLLVAYFTA